MAHVGDVYTDFPVAVLEFLNRQGVVKVLGIGRVDGERGHIAHIDALGNLLGGDARLQGFGSLGNVLGILVGQAKLSQDSMNLGIVLTSHTQHVNHLADGRVGILGPVHNLDDHLVTGLAAGKFVERDEDIGGQELAICCQLGKILQHLQGADKHLLLALQDSHHFGLGFHAVARRPDVNQHTVTVQGMHRVAARPP